MAADRARQVAVLVGVAGGMALGASGDYGSSTSANTRIVPADAAFAVWGPIYAGAVGYALQQARPSRRDDATLAAIGWPAATAYLTSGVWVHVLEDAPLPVGLALLGTTAGAALTVTTRLGRAPAPADATERWLVRAPLGLFAGWISLATVVAAAEVLVDRGADVLATDVGGGALLAAGSALGAAYVRRARPPATFAGALTFGLAAVGAARARRHPTLASVAAAGAATVAAAELRTRRVPPRRRPDRPRRL